MSGASLDEEVECSTQGPDPGAEAIRVRLEGAAVAEQDVQRCTECLEAKFEVSQGGVPGSRPRSRLS